jgi:hypothetical protein
MHLVPLHRGFTFTLRLQGVILFAFSAFVLFAATNVSQLLMVGGLVQFESS